MEILVSLAMQAATAPHPAYKARDMVNAPAIKQRIRERSLQRGDSQDVTDWLGNHFYRHLVGNFQADAPTLQPVASNADLQALLGRKPAPPWAAERLHKKASGFEVPDLWWLEPDAAAVLALEARLVEFLTTRSGTSLQGKLQRINCPQALARWTLEHLAFERKRHAGRHEHRPEAVRDMLRGQLGSFVEFDGQSAALREEMAYESQMMGHCLGQFAERKQLRGGYGERYAEACEKGRMRLFSYRTGSAQPRITVNTHVREDGLLEIEQIKGKQNRPPIARYVPDVVALLNHLPLNHAVPEDALAMGIVRRPVHLLSVTEKATPWCAVDDLQTEAEQLWLLQTHPELLSQLCLAPSPLMQWLLMASPDTMPPLERMPRSNAVQQTLDLAKKRTAAAPRRP